MLCILALTLGGCARLGERLVQTPVPPGWPEVSEILDDLAANDEVIQRFKATGTFTLESPDLTAVQRFRSSTIAFQRPADLYVAGCKYLGSKVFRLTCVGDEFLVEFPATRDDPYYRIEGEEFGSLPGRKISPAEIAQEMFLPEDWGALKRRRVRLTDYDETTQTALLEIDLKAARRRVTVQGLPWVVTRNELLDKDGQLLALTLKEDYREIDAVRFPAFIDTRFPAEDSRMTLQMRSIDVNTELEDDLFDIAARAREAGLHFDSSTGPHKP